jgi:hypothetical protein
MVWEYNIISYLNNYILQLKTLRGQRRQDMNKQTAISFLLAISVTLSLAFFIRYLWIKTIERNPRIADKIPWAFLQVVASFVVLVLWEWLIYLKLLTRPLVEGFIGIILFIAFFVIFAMGSAIINTAVNPKK